SQYEYWLNNFCVDHLERNLGSIEDEILDSLLFINKGVPGELTSNFLTRVDVDLIKIRPKPDYAIIIGGTNDLGWGIPNDKILANLVELHEISKDFGIKSIGGTIPPIRMEQSSVSYNQRKIELNIMLKEYFLDKEIPHADLYKGMMDDEGNLKNEWAYIDGLHFSMEGYRQMGKVIFQDTVKPIIERVYF
ncbi:MAG: hypothetical protein EU539_05320, partial [Promethearchaeota archaeon]